MYNYLLLINTDSQRTSYNKCTETVSLWPLLWFQFRWWGLSHPFQYYPVKKNPLPYFELLIFLLFFYLGKPWAWSFLFSLSIIFCIKKKNAFIDKNKRDDLEPENISQLLDVTERDRELKSFYCLEKDQATLYLGINQLGLLVYSQMISVSDSNSMKNKINSKRLQHMGYKL